MVPLAMASSMGKRVLPGTCAHDKGSASAHALRDGVEEGEGTHPAVLLRLLPRLAALTDADDDVDAVVASVEALPVTLRAVADEGERVVLEVLLELGEGPVCERESGFEKVSSVVLFVVGVPAPAQSPATGGSLSPAPCVPPARPPSTDKKREALSCRGRLGSQLRFRRTSVSSPTRSTSALPAQLARLMRTVASSSARAPSLKCAARRRPKNCWSGERGAVDSRRTRALVDGLLGAGKVEGLDATGRLRTSGQVISLQRAEGGETSGETTHRRGLGQGAGGREERVGAGGLGSGLAGGLAKGGDGGALHLCCCAVERERGGEEQRRRARISPGATLSACDGRLWSLDSKCPSRSDLAPSASSGSRFSPRSQVKQLARSLEMEERGSV